MTLAVTIVVGNPKPQSRTRQVAEALARQLLEPGSYELEIIELAEHAAGLFDWSSSTVAALNARVAASDLAIFASPTYKATYTGLLKAFLDRYPTNGLQGVVALPLLTGGDAHHAMGPNVNLVPLLLELGASVPGRGMYFIASQMEQLDAIVGAAATEYRANLARLARISAVARATSAA